MQELRVPATGAEGAAAGPRAPGRLVPPAAMSSALGVLVWTLLDWALKHRFLPTWPIAASAGLLTLGLLAEPLAQRTANRSAPASAQPAAAFAGLILLSYGAADPHPRSPLLFIAAFLLSLCLAAGPFGRRLASARSAPEAALPTAAIIALLVFMWAMSLDGYSWWTASGGRFTIDDLRAGTIRVLIALLALVLGATATSGPAVLRRLCASAAAAAALTVLLSTLTSSPPLFLSPTYPYYCAAAILSAGLVVDLPWLVGFRPAEVLAMRVDTLARSRSGALEVQAAELRRIERDLHDGAQVRLIALSMKLGRAEARYRDDPVTAALLREAREDATAAVRELRELARGIAPAVLASRGLDAAVESLAQRAGLEVTVDASVTRRPLPAVETAAYFVVAESLANAAKHAADARVEIRLGDHGGDLFVEVTDFGPGGADPAGSGLTGLRQRVEALDGVLHVTSPAGVGTQIEAVLPCGR